MLSTICQAARISINEFLSKFFPDPTEPIHLRAIKPHGVAQTGFNAAEKLKVTREELAGDKKIQQHLRNLNETRGIYFIPNTGGDTDAAITGFNAVFCERDDLSIREQHLLLDQSPLQTSIRVETLKSVHAYWLISGACLEIEWRQMQARIIAYFKSDPAIKNPSRLMRLPNYNHVSIGADGSLQYKRVVCVQLEPSRRYTGQEMLAAFPEPTSKRARSNGHQGDTLTGKWEIFTTWNDLNTELRRRILSHPTCRMSRNEWAHAKGICHDGKGDKAIAINLATGAYKCHAGCDKADILKAFGLPGQPHGVATTEEADAKLEHGSVILRRLADVQAEHVTWLWYPFIPKGKVTLVEGDPGVGKSWLVLALATAIAAGKGLPNSEPTEPRNILLLIAEDGLSDTILPRLDRMRADVSNIYALEGAFVFDDAGLLQLEGKIIECNPALITLETKFVYIGHSQC